MQRPGIYMMAACVALLAVVAPARALGGHALDLLAAPHLRHGAGEEALWGLRLLALAAPQHLPPNFWGSGTGHATPWRWRLAAEHDRFSPPLKALAAELGLTTPTGRAAQGQGVFLRPVMNNEQTTDVAGFRVHYTTTGTHAAPQDYVNDVVAVLATLKDTQLTALGYPAPPGDGDGIYDVYLQNLYNTTTGTGYYGYVQPDTFTGDNPNTTQTETGARASYMVIENDLAESVFKSPTTALRQLNLQATLAHEFFHAVQFGLGLENFTAEESWLLESTAVWMEETVFPDSNVSYTEYTDNFFTAPDLPLITTDAAQGLGSASPAPLHEYGAFLFWTFAEDHATAFREALKNLFLRQGNGQAGTLLSEIALALAQAGAPDIATLSERLASANALRITPAQAAGRGQAIANLTHRDAGNFAAIGGLSGSAWLGLEAVLTYNGGALSHHSASQGNNRLGPLGADYLGLNVASPVTVSLTAQTGDLSLMAITGSGAQAAAVQASGGNLTLFPTGSMVILRVANRSTNQSGTYQLNLSAASPLPVRCEVDGAAPLAASPHDVGDAAALLLATQGVDPAGRCAQGQCNFDGALSNPDPTAADLAAFVQAVVEDNPAAVGCQ